MEWSLYINTSIHQYSISEESRNVTDRHRSHARESGSGLSCKICRNEGLGEIWLSMLRVGSGGVCGNSCFGLVDGDGDGDGYVW